MKELISQQLAIEEWPTMNLGEERFFGYVISMGMTPCEYGPDCEAGAYVDFSYGDSYRRFRLPKNDCGLKKRLSEFLLENMDSSSETGGVYGKVVIKRLEVGYSVEYP